MSLIVSTLYDCYDRIIGLSRTECTCQDPKGDFDTSFNESYSGLFIDELEPLNVLAGLENCVDDVWEIMDRARSNAIIEFVNDASRSLIQHNMVRVQPFTGAAVGRMRQDRFKNLATDYAGAHIMCKRIIGGYMTLKKVHLNMAVNGNITIQIRDNVGALYNSGVENGNLVSMNYTATPGLWQPFDAEVVPAPGETAPDVKLKLWSDYVDNLHYYIFYEREQFNAGQQPVDNDLYDRNRKRICFCPNRPTYLMGQNDSYRWAESIMIGGFDTDDVTQFLDQTVDYGGYNNMNGMILEFDFNCDVGMVLCKEDGMNFESDPLAIATAEAIRYKAAELLADMIFAGIEKNYTTMINRENLATEQAEWRKKYMELIDYIGLETDVTKTDCLVCKDNQPINKGTILS